MESVRKPALLLLAALVSSSLLAGALARSIVINQSSVPILIEEAMQQQFASNLTDNSVLVGAKSSLELPRSFTSASIILRNQLSGGTFGPFTLGRNAAMVIQSNGLLGNTVTVLLGTLVRGIVTALTTLIASL